jgi:hypothetical protein
LPISITSPKSPPPQLSKESAQTLSMTWTGKPIRRLSSGARLPKWPRVRC